MTAVLIGRNNAFRFQSLPGIEWVHSIFLIGGSRGGRAPLRVPILSF